MVRSGRGVVDHRGWTRSGHVPPRFSMCALPHRRCPPAHALCPVRAREGRRHRPGTSTLRSHGRAHDRPPFPGAIGTSDPPARRCPSASPPAPVDRRSCSTLAPPAVSSEVSYRGDRPAPRPQRSMHRAEEGVSRPRRRRDGQVSWRITTSPPRAPVTHLPARAARTARTARGRIEVDRLRPTRCVLADAPAPFPETVAFDRAVHSTSAAIDNAVRSYRADGKDHGDVLSRLLATRDTDGRPLTDRQIRDPPIGFGLAGYETTGASLAWIFHELGHHPSRRRGDPLQRLRVAPRSPLVPRPGTHRPRPLAPDRARSIPKGAYIPFRAGAHKCIGDSLAFTEMAIILAVACRRRRLSPVPGVRVREGARGDVHPNRHPMMAAEHIRSRHVTGLTSASRATRHARD